MIWCILRVFNTIKSEYLRRFRPSEQTFRRNESLGAPDIERDFGKDKKACTIVIYIN